MKPLLPKPAVIKRERLDKAIGYQLSAFSQKFQQLLALADSR
jgi:hypothetical protein